MSRKADLPIIVGSNLKKGLMCMRVKGGYDMWIVWLNREFKTGERFELEDIDKLQAVIHFTDREAVQNTIDALTAMIKSKPRKRKSKRGE
jgi:hypothetical protein